MDHWQKYVLPGLDSLLKEGSPLRDITFVCADGRLDSFRALYRELPGLPSSENAAHSVVILPDVLLKDLQCIQESLISSHRGGEAMRILPEYMWILRSLGFKGAFFSAKRVENPRSIKNTCNICEKVLSSAQALKNHLALHEEDRPHQCRSCPRAFVTALTLQAHITSVHENKSFHPCPHCVSTAFKSRSHLARHVRFRHFEHSDKRTFLCEDCGKSFADSSGLSSHAKIHTGYRPHPCRDCDKRFLTATKLRIHRRSHTGERPYGCRDCGSSFATKCQLKAHALAKHSMGKTLCPLCGDKLPESFKEHKCKREIERKQKSTEDSESSSGIPQPTDAEPPLLIIGKKDEKAVVSKEPSASIPMDLWLP